MGTRQLWLVLAFLLLLPGEVMAHRHRARVYFIPRSWLFDSDFRGWAVSGDWPIAKEHEVSAFGGFSRYSGTEDGEEFTLLAYTAGVRYTVARREWSTWFPFVQLSGGGVEAIQKIDEDTSRHRTHGIAVLGLGIDRRLTGDLGRHQLRVRLQIDCVHRFNGKTGIAFSLGLGWQFPDLCPKKQCP